MPKLTHWVLVAVHNVVSTYLISGSATRVIGTCGDATSCSVLHSVMWCSAPCAPLQWSCSVANGSTVGRCILILCPLACIVDHGAWSSMTALVSLLQSWCYHLMADHVILVGS